jgi:predicted transcriptional regulator
MKRKPFGTKLNPELIKALKYLAVELEKPINYLLEEAIIDLLKKYGKEVKEAPEGEEGEKE